MDDDGKFRLDIRMGLGEKVEVLFAWTHDQARTAVANDKGIVLILMDACLKGNTPDTLELVREIREIFPATFPIIGVSSSANYCEMLIQAGCNYGIVKDYPFDTVIEKVLGELRKFRNFKPKLELKLERKKP